MATPDLPRSADEMQLQWVELRRSGVGICKIANMFGVTESVVEKATSRIRRDDMDLSGEPPLMVAAHYWKARKKKCS